MALVQTKRRRCENSLSLPKLILSSLYCLTPPSFLLMCRQKLHPIPGLPSVFGRVLLLSHPGDGLVLGCGERGSGGAEAQPPERHSHPRAAGEEWTPHYHRPPGKGLWLLPPIGNHFKALLGGSRSSTPFISLCRPAPAGCCTTCCLWCRFGAGLLWPKAG